MDRKEDLEVGFTHSYLGYPGGNLTKVHDLHSVPFNSR